MITLMKTGPYNPLGPRLDKYESYQLVTLHKYDPSLDNNLMEDCLKNTKLNLTQVDYILTSDLRRTKETAQYLINHDLAKRACSFLHYFHLHFLQINLYQN